MNSTTRDTRETGNASGRRRRSASSADNVLNIGLDLGGDTLKVSFAYEQDGIIEYGKFAGKSKLNQIALPALAYYDLPQGRWFFADEIDRQGSESFITVVKIKTLISLLSLPDKPKPEMKNKYDPLTEEEKAALRTEWKQRLAVWKKNKPYYFKGHAFPKFYFPVKRAALYDFDKMVSNGMTFTVESDTPQSVCETFFRYVRNLVDERKAELEEKLGRTFDSYRVALVHPAQVGDDYLAELSDLIRKTFGSKPAKVLNTNKALALYANHRKSVEENESFLVFDMGEESISVVQATILGGQVAIDGAEGHSAPINIGGNDVDEAIVHFLEESIVDRETLGTPPAGTEGHIQEESVYSKQYLLMKDVKKAKVIFSKPLKEDSSFHRGVPVNFSREVLVHRRLTKDDVEGSIGIKTGTGIAKKIVKYMLDEIQLPINRNVRKIFVSGGLTETYALLDYIRSELRSNGCRWKVCTFEDERREGDCFSILSFEDSVFAPAVGGAIVALKDIDIQTVLSMSYGTWEQLKNGDGTKVLTLFVNKGEIIPEGGKEFSKVFTVGGRNVANEEMYSTVVTQQEIDEHIRTLGKWRSLDGRLVVGEPGSLDRVRAEIDVDLKCVSGGSAAGVIYLYKGRRIGFVEPRDYFNIEEGIRVDKHGSVEPFVRNAGTVDKMVRIGYWDERKETYTSYETISCNSIEPRFDGLFGWDS